MTAKFNYFEMTAGVMLGIAAGHWLRALVSAGEGMAKLWQIGSLLMIFSFVLSAEMDQLGLWFVWPKLLYLWLWLFYGGAILVLLSVMFRLTSMESGRAGLDRFLRSLAIVGIMAFPLYIGSEMTVPFKDFLEALHVPAPILISLLLFFATFGYLLVRLYKVYYSNAPASGPGVRVTDFLVGGKTD
jgi:hypothetical protein